MKTKGKANLYAASNEWAQRPADERFWTLKELLQKSRKYADESSVTPVAMGECQVLPNSGFMGQLALELPDMRNAAFQHYSFGQLAGLVGAPAAYLRTLPTDVAAHNLNHGLQQLSGGHSLLLHQNGGLHLRCVTSLQYERIWNYQIAELALALEENEGWVTPPARPCGQPGVPVRKATKDDVLHKTAHANLGIHVGDDISPAGLYCSDHDVFIFQVNEAIAIDAGGGEMLHRGIFWRNSEVGDARFTGTMFLYDTVCGNHIVWDAKVLAEISIRHIGEPARMFEEAMVRSIDMMQSSANEDRMRISAAKQFTLGASQEEVIKKVSAGRIVDLSKQECEDAYTLAERYADQHGDDPNTAWGYAAGITRLSQGVWADNRLRMDKAAGKVLAMAVVR